jgi:hypothetical protein
MFNTIDGAGATSRYGSDQKMRLRLPNTGFKCSIFIKFGRQMAEISAK